MKVDILDLKQRYQEEKVGLLRCIKRVLEKGNLIVYTKGRNRERENVYSTSNGRLKATEIIILINEGYNLLKI